MRAGILKSKKADISVTILVLLALLLSASSLFVFLVFEYRAKNTLLGIGPIEDSYAKEDGFKLFLRQTAKSVADENPGISAEEFAGKFKERYTLEAVQNSFLDKYKNQIENNAYDMRIEGGRLYFRLKDFTFIERPGLTAEGGIGFIRRTTDIYFEISLKTPSS